MASRSPCRSTRTLEATKHAGYTLLNMLVAELAAPSRSTRPSDRTTELVVPAHTAHDNGAHSARGGAPPWWRRSLPNPGRAGKHASILVLILFGCVRHPLTWSQPRGGTTTGPLMARQLPARALLVRLGRRR